PDEHAIGAVHKTLRPAPGRTAFLLLVDLLEIGVDDFLAIRSGTATARTTGTGAAAGTARLGSAAAGLRLVRRLAGLALTRRHLVAGLFECPLGGVDQALGLVLGLDQLAPLLVLVGVGFGVLDHLLDV